MKYSVYKVLDVFPLFKPWGFILTGILLEHFIDLFKFVYKIVEWKCFNWKPRGLKSRKWKIGT